MSSAQEVFAAFEHSERRIFAALSRQPIRNLTSDQDRCEVRALLERSLGLARIPEPTMRVSVMDEKSLGGCHLQCLAGTSWPGATVTAHLYLPDTPPPWPVVLVCCGHGDLGKTTYAPMGLRLARQGAAALINDNIGQGERMPMGHGQVTTPFALGFSVQGMIVRESLAWLQWLKQDRRFTRLGAAGNSGGGTLTMCLAALSDDLAALVSTGYPSSFELIARKQKRHCHCNLFPGAIGRFDMWELYALFAPRPLLIMQGRYDNLFLLDSFLATARKIKHIYQALGAATAFASAVPDGQHSWDAPRRQRVGDFFATHFGIRKPLPDDEDCREPILDASFAPCQPSWPADALDANALAGSFTGTHLDPLPNLWDIYPPAGLPGPWPALSDRGPSEQILAQWECFLADI
ncbi:MAG: hypothetical protein PHT80_10600 [Lentisphaeria bacterium]|nr:hypothetical protein [Lentisphaeria bacterium]